MVLSVVMITFGHERYIRDAVLGVLNQKCDFEFELIVSNDCSPDSTHQIMLSIIENHSKGHIIKYTCHARNKGPALNTIWALNQGKGKYIALCEGDDYWTDLYKLQRQVDFLEKNPNYSFCFHSVTVLNETKAQEFKYPIPKSTTLTFRDILFKHYIPTCSVVFRRSLMINPLPSWLEKSKMCDIPLELLLADKGNVYYFKEDMAVYRLNNSGITQNKEHIANGRKSYLYLYKSLRNHFGNKYFFLFSLMILKNQIGYLKDLIGFNPLLTKSKKNLRK